MCGKAQLIAHSAPQCRPLASIRKTNTNIWWTCKQCT